MRKKAWVVSFLTLTVCFFNVSQAEENSRIAAHYKTEVEPLFRKACFDCHTNQTRFPWYHSIPGVKQWMDHHIEEAQEELKLSEDFLFTGEGSPEKKLRKIWKEIEEGEMAPFYYRLMHREARLGSDEKEKIKNWIQFALKELGYAPLE